MLVKYTEQKSELDLRRKEFKGRYLFIGHAPTEMSRVDGETAIKLFPEIFSEAIVESNTPETQIEFCKRIFGKHLSKVTKKEIDDWSGEEMDLQKSKKSLIEQAMDGEK